MTDRYTSKTVRECVTNYRIGPLWVTVQTSFATRDLMLIQGVRKTLDLRHFWPRIKRCFDLYRHCV